MKKIRNENTLFVPTTFTLAVVLNITIFTPSFAETVDKNNPPHQEISKLLANAKSNNLYQQCGQQPLLVQKEDYQKNYRSLRDLSGIYINIDDIIKGAKKKRNHFR